MNMKGGIAMDDRKLKILAAVVDEYVRTGEPVGSKAISKLENIKVSSATIRNDMAALEQMGYLEKGEGHNTVADPYRNGPQG